MVELTATGLTRGWIITRHGKPYPPAQLSIDSHWHLRELGIDTTLHSMRHTFATTTWRTTHDILLVRDLLGHESVSTTEIYADPDTSHAHERLAGVAASARDLMSPRRLHAVKDSS